jgi:hypothetical protein
MPFNIPLQNTPTKFPFFLLSETYINLVNRTENKLFIWGVEA